MILKNVFQNDDFRQKKARFETPHWWYPDIHTKNRLKNQQTWLEMEIQRGNAETTKKNVAHAWWWLKFPRSPGPGFRTIIPR